MPTLQELRDQRATAWTQAQEYNQRAETGTDMSAEDDAAWTRALDEVDRLGEQIAQRERTANLNERFQEVDDETTERSGGSGSGVPGDPTGEAAYREAFNQFCRQGMAELSVEQRTLLREHFDAELRAQGTNTGAAGGYTVPEGFWAKVTETMKYFGGAAEGAEEITTTTGNNIPWPTNDDTANKGYYLGENVQATNEGDLTFGQKTLTAFTNVSGPVLLSFALAQDSGVDIEAFIARKMGERLARRSNLAFTSGGGSTEPAGYIPSLTTGKTTASGTAIILNELIDLVHSVDAAYRASGRCRFKLHDLVLAYVRKIRDDSGGSGLGRPIWEPSVQAGVPDLLLGYPYTVNNDQDSAITSGKKTVAFGDFQSAFVIRRIVGGQMMRLTERYADYLQIGFIGFERHDSIVQDPSAAKLLVQA